VSAATSAAAGEPRAAERGHARVWVAVFGAILGAFMAVLDIQIVNSSLQYIQGGLAASIDEGSWISTAYLVAEIIIIPLTSWLTQVFSVRRYLLFSCIGFLVFSIACGFASSLGMMILCRIGQGFTGGALIPMALTMVTTRLPKSKQPTGLALFGFTAIFAPAIGPALGGWLTVTYSWHYIFYVNTVPGLILIWSVWYAVEPEAMRLDLLREGDWFGIFFMATGLGSLIAVLEEGERKAWFTTDWIRYAALAAAICLPIAIILELTGEKPFIDLSLLRNRGLGPAAIIGLTLGLGLYGTVYILPLYLAQVQGYDPFQIGQVVMWMGAPQLLILPIMPIFMRYIDLRYLVAFGMMLFAGSGGTERGRSGAAAEEARAGAGAAGRGAARAGTAGRRPAALRQSRNRDERDRQRHRYEPSAALRVRHRSIRVGKPTMRSIRQSDAERDDGKNEASETK
jgi:MFS transporter, DHA2 family, multidrug resistance protein